MSESFDNGDPFPHGFDGTSTTDTDDGPSLPASVFTIGGKVAVQVWLELIISITGPDRLLDCRNYGGCNQVPLDHQVKTGTLSPYGKEGDDSLSKNIRLYKKPKICICT